MMKLLRYVNTKLRVSMDHPPVVIGGVGGSGTRLIASILKDVGFFLGADLNRAHDNLWFTLLFKRRELWPLELHESELTHLLEIFLDLMLRRKDISAEDRQLVGQMANHERPKHDVEWLRERLQSILAVAAADEVRPGLWGWKEPNTHVFLPVLLSRIGDFKYVHVMRHGVDMAFSRNQNQLEFWGEQLLGRAPNIDDPVDSLSYWCTAHKRVLELTSPMKDRFLLLNYDKFCREPARELPLLLKFLGLDANDFQLEELVGENLMPRSLGRHMKLDISVFPSSDLDYVRSLGFQL